MTLLWFLTTKNLWVFIQFNRKNLIRAISQEVFTTIGGHTWLSMLPTTHFSPLNQHSGMLQPETLWINWLYYYRCGAILLCSLAPVQIQMAGSSCKSSNIKAEGEIKGYSLQHLFSHWEQLQQEQNPAPLQESASREQATCWGEHNYICLVSLSLTHKLTFLPHQRGHGTSHCTWSLWCLLRPTAEQAHTSSSG